MIIWTAEKKALDEGALKNYPTYQRDVEEAFANAVIAHKAYLNHKNQHLFESGLKNSFLTPLQEAMQNEHAKECTIEITPYDLDILGKSKVDLLFCLGQMEKTLGESVKITLQSKHPTSIPFKIKLLLT